MEGQASKVEIAGELQACRVVRVWARRLPPVFYLMVETRLGKGGAQCRFHCQETVLSLEPLDIKGNRSIVCSAPAHT
jgi:hypothetical protein